MANLTFSKEQSAVINAGRQQVSTPNGDMWRILPGRVTDSERFAMAAEYEALEVQIDTTKDAGFDCFLTYGDNTLHGIGKAPNRPKPPTS